MLKSVAVTNFVLGAPSDHSDAQHCWGVLPEPNQYTEK